MLGNSVVKFFKFFNFVILWEEEINVLSFESIFRFTTRIFLLFAIAIYVYDYILNS
jgi:hypothetical protein